MLTDLSSGNLQNDKDQQYDLLLIRTKAGSILAACGYVQWNNVLGNLHFVNLFLWWSCWRWWIAGWTSWLFLLLVILLLELKPHSRLALDDLHLRAAPPAVVPETKKIELLHNLPDKLKTARLHTWTLGWILSKH